MVSERMFIENARTEFPTNKFIDLINNFINSAENILQIKKIRHIFKAELKHLKQKLMVLNSQLQTWETQREPYLIDLKFYNRQQLLRQRIFQFKENQRQRDSKYQAELSLLQFKLGELHRQIIEANQKSFLVQIKILVANNELQIKEEIQALRNKIQTSYLCWPFNWIFSCFSKKDRETRKKIAFLIRERDNLQSNDPEKVKTTLVFRLEEKRKILQQQMHKLLKFPPKDLPGAGWEDELAEIEARLNINEAKFSYKVNHPILVLLAETYSEYSKLLNKILPTITLTADPKLSKARTELQPLNARINFFFENFWCPDNNNQTALLYYNQHLREPLPSNVQVAGVRR